MNYGQFETALLTSLTALYGNAEATAITDLVLSDIKNTSRQQRRIEAEEEIQPDVQLKLNNAKAQLLQHEPVQYVLGHTYFFGLKFLVNKSVLIPRPETEELVEWVISTYKNNKQPLYVLDIGTGSGCVPVTIKKKLPFAAVSSLDISNEAIYMAEKNAAFNEVEISLMQLDFLDDTNWPLLGKYNAIVSNPPYIPEKEKPGISKNVIDWEPHMALFVPDDDPLLFYKKIAAFGKTHLQECGTIFMETHQQYAGAVQQLFIENGYTAEIRKDINGNERMVKAVNCELSIVNNRC